MKPTNGRASTIFIRDLSKKDNTALKQVREDFKTEFNTVAVMKSLYNYLEQKNTIANQQEQIKKLHNQVDALTDSLNEIKDSIRNYFTFQEEKEKRQEEFSRTLAQFVQSPGTQRKRSSVRPGLAAILSR